MNQQVWLIAAWVLAAATMAVSGGCSARLHTSGSSPESDKSYPPLEVYKTVMGGDPSSARVALNQIEENWRPGSAIMLVEMARWVDRQPIALPLQTLVSRKLGLQRFDAGDASEAIWKLDYEPHPEYAEFKRQIMSLIDFRMGEHFYQEVPTTIRLDQIQWGGVVRDGIPPLRQPKMIAAGEADWLADEHVVFGIEINGDARAYPKRILAWHEMFVDTVGGVPLAGVYCTLCGTVVVYETTFDDTNYKLGTSGMLYQSNKLMYDAETSSLWSTMTGQPVVGRLVGQGIQLARWPVVTTTWGSWREQHPETSVLSLDTGYQRDYHEGVAYRDYFATDRLMFPVPRRDDRLANKAEVLGLRSESGDEALAISADFLVGNSVYHDRLGDMKFVVLTDAAGANRVYQSGDVTFDSWDGATTAIDEAGARYKFTETALRGPDGNDLKRLPAHRSFWFGWYAAFPDTRLVE